LSKFDLKDIIDSINIRVRSEIKIMEVCGTHTQAIAKAGLSNMLDSRIQLISGPGCPVCVTPEGYIDAAIELLQQPNTIIVTFGDMIRVKGSVKSLEDCMEMKARIKVVYSPFTALDMAENNKQMQIIFLAVGFETTAPLIAVIVKLALQKGIKNLFFLVGLKLMPPILDKVLSSKGSKLDALICPGHVSVIMGSEYFGFVPEKYSIPAVISGFEYVDVATAVYYLFEEVQKGEKNLINLYPKYVRPQGNKNAKELMREVFKSKEGCWRGIGRIDSSELTLKNEFLGMDAAKSFDIRIKNPSVSVACQCGDIITGSKSPFQCSLFCESCTPEDPRGPCMVSSEGACAIYYKYKRGNLA
jgi:hydrogenase expression/formation protein HypD